MDVNIYSNFRFGRAKTSIIYILGGTGNTVRGRDFDLSQQGTVNKLGPDFV